MKFAHPGTRRRPTWASGTWAAPSRGLPRLVTVFALGTCSDAFLILRAQNVGMAVALIPRVIPLVYFAFNALYALLAPPAGGLSDRIGQRRRGGTALGTQCSGGAQRSGDQGPPTARPTHRSTASRSASTAPTAGAGGVAQHGGVVQGAAGQDAAVPDGVGVGAPPEEEPHAERVGLADSNGENTVDTR